MVKVGVVGFGTIGVSSVARGDASRLPVVHPRALRAPDSQVSSRPMAT